MTTPAALPALEAGVLPEGWWRCQEKKRPLTPATERIVLIKEEFWLSADGSRRRGGVREGGRAAKGRRKLACWGRKEEGGGRGQQPRYAGRGDAPVRRFAQASNLHFDGRILILHQWLQRRLKLLALKTTARTSGVEDSEALCTSCSSSHSANWPVIPMRTCLGCLYIQCLLCAFKGVSSRWYS